MATRTENNRGRQVSRLVIALCAVLLLGSQDVTADECEDVGKLGMMLGQMDKQCEKYRLTDAGRKVMLTMAAKAVPLGGEMCAAKGKVAMLQQLSVLFPSLDKAAASGNAKTFNRALCEALAQYLEIVDGDRDTKMIARR